MKKPAIILSLSTEVIVMIGNQILWPYGFRKYSRWTFWQGDLSRLSRTCKRLRNIFKHMLFEHFSLVYHPSHHPNPTLIRLVEALRAQPDLARNMKSVSIYIDKFAGVSVPDDSNNPRLRDLADRGRWLLSDSAPQLGHGYFLADLMPTGR